MFLFKRLMIWIFLSGGMDWVGFENAKFWGGRATCILVLSCCSLLWRSMAKINID
jgi:hypothetical protein